MLKEIHVSSSSKERLEKLSDFLKSQSWLTTEEEAEFCSSKTDFL